MEALAWKKNMTGQEEEIFPTQLNCLYKLREGFQINGSASPYLPLQQNRRLKIMKQHVHRKVRIKSNTGWRSCQSLEVMYEEEE